MTELPHCGPVTEYSSDLDNLAWTLNMQKDNDKDKDNLTWMLYMQAPVSRSQTHSRPSTDADPAVEGESRSGGIYCSHVVEEYCQCYHL